MFRESLERSGFYYDAKQLEGMLAGLMKDEVGVRQKFRAAILSSGGDPIVRTNYAHALSNVRCMIDSVKAIDDVCEQYPDDVKVLLAALEIHENAYDPEGCYKLIERIDTLGMSHKISAEKLDKLDDMAYMLEGRNVTWADLAERIERASKSVFRLGLAMHSITESISRDGALFELGIIGNVDDALRAERAIHEDIAAQPYSPADSVLSFACIPDEYQSH